MKQLKKIQFNNNKPVPKFGANLKDTIKLVDEQDYLGLLKAGVELTLLGTVTEVSNVSPIATVVELERGIPKLDINIDNLVHTGEVVLEPVPLENAPAEVLVPVELNNTLETTKEDVPVEGVIVTEEKVETLEEKTVDELKELAKTLKIQFKYSITKSKLIELIEKKQSAN
jgi:hypothetical protein